MKYLLLDTNIYIDMIVSRESSHKPESYYNLEKILNFTDTKLLVPKIVKHELFRHIENEIEKIGRNLNKSKHIINDLYWINETSELNEFNNNKKSILNNLTRLIGEFKASKDTHVNHYKLQFNNLFEHRNVIMIEENNNILAKVMKRKTYKLRPFHSNDKNSNADAVIIETILNIEDFIEDFNINDKIYFISKNDSDFAYKNNKDTLHSDIAKDIESKLGDNFYFSCYFTKILLTEFKYEIDLAGIEIEQLEAEAEAEKLLNYKYFVDLDRENIGLNALNPSQYEYEIIDNYQMHQLIETINDYIQIINEKRDKLYDFELPEGNPDLISEIEYKYSSLDFIDDIELNEVILNYDIFNITGFNNDDYYLRIEGELFPSNDDFDFLDVNLYKNKDVISSGSIEIYYGFVEVEDSGNIGNASEESITFNLYEIYESLKELTDQINHHIDFLESDIKSCLSSL